MPSGPGLARNRAGPAELAHLDRAPRVHPGIALLLWFITRWIVSAVVIKITASLSSRLQVDGFLPAVITAFIVALTGSGIRWVL